MHALLMLAALFTAAPVEPPKVERWIPITNQPGWEMFGKEDATGKFIYSQTRFKRATPTKNYGVNLSSPPAYGHSLTGPPSEVVRDLASTLDTPLSAGSDAALTADCDDGRCPPDRRKPEELPEKPPWHGLSPDELKIVLVAVGVIALGTLSVVGLLIVFAIGRWVFRTFFGE